MIKRTNSASGAYLLKRAARLAKEVRQKYGRKTEIVDGFIVEGKRTKDRYTATVLEPPGTLVSFGAFGTIGVHATYAAPLRSFFDPRRGPSTPGAEAPELMLDGVQPEVVAFVYGTPPAPSRRLYTEGTPWEGNAGVYHLTITDNPAVSGATRPYWLQLHHQPAGAGDGRAGFVMSDSILRQMAPGYDVVLRETTSNQPGSLPIPTGCEVGDYVFVTIQMIQARTAPSGLKSPCNAVLMFLFDSKNGGFPWWRVYKFDDASNPYFRPEVMNWTDQSGSYSLWADASASLLRVEKYADKIAVGFIARTQRAYQVSADDANVVRLWSVGVLTIQTEPEVVNWTYTDAFHYPDVRDGQECPFITPLGASPNYYTYGDYFRIYNGKVGIWRQVWERPLTDPDFDSRSQYPEKAWFHIDGQFVTDATTLGYRAEGTTADDETGTGTYFNSGQFNSKASYNLFLEAWYRVPDDKPVVVVVNASTYAITIEDCFSAWSPSTLRSGLLSVTCYQREVWRDEVLLVPAGVLAFADTGGEHPVVALKRGDQWEEYPAVNYGRAGVAYTGNPLLTKPYGYLFAGDAP